MIDLNGQAIAGLELSVKSLTRHDTGQGEDWVGAYPSDEILNWPRPFKSDDQGRFTLAGIGRDMTVYLGIRDPRFAKETIIQVQTTESASLKELELRPPADDDRGRAGAGGRHRAACSACDRHRRLEHQPVLERQRLSFLERRPGPIHGERCAGSVLQHAGLSPEGQPYLIPEHRFEWDKGGVKRAMDIVLPRGVLIRGKVIDKVSGRPLTEASVQFCASPRSDEIIDGWQSIVASKSDGSFEIAVPAGKGHLIVFGPTPDFILKEIGQLELWYGPPGGRRNYAHDIIPYEVQFGDSSRELVAELRPGKTVKGRVLSPEGQPVEKAALLSRLEAEDLHTTWRVQAYLFARDGRFELHGLDPEVSVPVIFFDADHEWGTTVEISGKQAGDDLTVRLERNGGASSDSLGPTAGRSRATRSTAASTFLVTPGLPNFSRKRGHRGGRLADAGDMENIDPRRYLSFPPADRDGRVTLPNLVPGALYRICDRSTEDVPEKGVQVRKEFTVKPGEELDLGEILIERPQG